VCWALNIASRRPRQHGHQRDQALQGGDGAEFGCPSFVEMGELIKIDTRTGEYIERVKG